MRDFLSRKSPIALAITIATTGAVGSLTIAPNAQAQESLTVGVVVTARKRDESLQNVPVAVSAL